MTRPDRDARPAPPRHRVDEAPLDAARASPRVRDLLDEAAREQAGAARERAHVLPRYPESWHYPSSRTPERTYVLLNKESPEFIRFVNPGDYRIAMEACGACHEKTIKDAHRSLMATATMFWGGAAYNNGLLPFKRYILGESYTLDATVGGQVTIRTTSGIPRDALPATLETLLRMNGATILNGQLVTTLPATTVIERTTN